MDANPAVGGARSGVSKDAESGAVFFLVGKEDLAPEVSDEVSEFFFFVNEIFGEWSKLCSRVKIRLVSTL
jgi:hypothetical protein